MRRAVRSGRCSRRGRAAVRTAAADRAAAGAARAALDLGTPVSRAVVSGAGPGGARVYGLVLERREAPGVLVHAAGAAGAEPRAFAGAEGFWTQAAALEPDLIVVALGTNDVFRPESRPGFPAFRSS